MSNTVKTINPFTEQVLDEFQLLSLEEANAAVDKSHEAFLSWRNTPKDQRAELVLSLASTIRENKSELLRLMTAEMGKVRAQGEQEIELCAGICEYTATEAIKALEDEEREIEGGKAIISYQPIGVILGIQPWNFPLYQVIRYSISNIMAGNTTVMKHASNVFGMAVEIQKMYKKAGFPKNVYQSLIIKGSMATQLIEHSKVRGVTFTGSDGVGKKVAETAGKHSKKTVLELGSNDAYVILDDANIETAVQACVQGRMINNGETCVAAKRFVVTEAKYDEFKQAFVDQLKNMKMGDPNDKETDLGPMAREDLRDELHEQVKTSIDKGAKVLIGCEIPDMTGYFYPPSVLENVQSGMPAYDDELFGPVAALIKVKDNEEAMKVANDSRYGLGGGIFSADEDKAVKMAIEEFDTGMVNINGYGLAQPNLPFGGVKSSGYGREHGGFGIAEFVNIKSVVINQQ
ncbi:MULTISPECIES: NAD-dependent succinate-semialdehyde dehydrogenase [Aliiglaciecola]|uniref:NAD-dependent succinate-semialdehyde dehydrogenase n=1 Tax=Aliiglaciecola TaxID=1406885 RepID=UPI001C09C673|nr:MULTISPECIES: NAD-dependent succinate-semialdehyde dehydrogenase [Aliiglaciecola]MBU2877606.1 NAD-dependent succinate-semialdehyde dehydrogenase [Aliiglaciecola lipolytica]MDO6711181.1 NAD-dependent succinate-semialdehyde dehydrogenase [Aliiglaciecola sp. 2_MG-2023]MDO6752095.1 NAD-dependent succinate-semialdehyde dehydrogenase [Aliiglaciecola sp. 1_MG-2023]